jgi:hypothetical protein
LSEALEEVVVFDEGALEVLEEVVELDEDVDVLPVERCGLA